MNGPIFGHSAPSDMAWTHYQPQVFHHQPPPVATRSAPYYGYDLPRLQPQPQYVEPHGPYPSHHLAPPFAPTMSNRHFQPAHAMPFQPTFPPGFYAPMLHQQQPVMLTPPPSCVPQRVEQPFPASYSPMRDVVFGSTPNSAHLDVDARRGRWNGGSAGWMQQQAASSIAHEQTRPPVRQSDVTHALAASSVQGPLAVAASSHEEDQVALLPTAPGEPLSYDLISNTSVVPPPPAIELSAVPLADLATEMVWEACALGVEAMAAPSGDQLFNKSLSLLTSSSIGSTSPSRSRGTNTPELTFGAIGEERRSRKPSAEHANSGLGSGWSSDFSSPSSSAPGTPDGFGALDAVISRRQKLSGLGFGYVGDGGKFVNGLLASDDDERRVLDSPGAAMRGHAKKLGSKMAASVSNNGISAMTLPAEPSPAFRQFVKQVLTATLLTPEDLVLALYYVARIPSRLFVQAPSADQGNGAAARASAIKSAPFKILLGALMLANKTLQDHNYRCDTWATVSAIPLKDVNALEVHIFGALDFDVAARDDMWAPWLTVVRERANARRGDIGDRFEVDQALLRMMRAARNHVLPPMPCPVPSSPATSTTDGLFSFDLDAAGPLRSPMKSRYSTPIRQKAVLPPLTRTYSQAVASELYNR